jgi:hypothetical protein
MRDITKGGLALTAWALLIALAYIIFRAVERIRRGARD